MDFSDYRNLDYSIDLTGAALDFLEKKYLSADGRDFLWTIEKIYPIRSRQVAALAIAMADQL